MPDPTAYLATMAGVSATLVAIIGGLSVNKFVGLDAEQQMTKREFEQAEAKAKLAAAELRLAEQRYEDEVAHELATNAEALGAIYRGTTDYDVIQRTYRLTKARGELGPRLMQHAQEKLTEARTYFEHQFAGTPTAEAVEDWSDAPSWREVQEAESLPDASWSTFWELAYKSWAGDQAERQRQERRNAHRGFALSEQAALLAATDPLAVLRETVARLPPPFLIQDSAALALGPLLRRSDTLASDVTTRQEINRSAQRELARMREQWEKSISPDGRQLIWGLAVLLLPTVLGVVLPVMELSTGATDFTTPIRLTAYGFYVGLAVLFGYMFYLASRLIPGHEARMRRITAPFKAVGRGLKTAARWVRSRFGESQQTGATAPS